MTDTQSSLFPTPTVNPNCQRCHHALALHGADGGCVYSRCQCQPLARNTDPDLAAIDEVLADTEVGA